jgi:DNA-binding CsgD family transcriptional regulator
MKNLIFIISEESNEDSADKKTEKGQPVCKIILIDEESGSVEIKFKPIVLKNNECLIVDRSILKEIVSLQNRRFYMASDDCSCKEAMSKISENYSICTEHEARKKANLTHMQLTVLKYVAKGYTKKEIATMLNKSVFTINKHVEKIYPKIKVNNKKAATNWVIDNVGFFIDGTKEIPERKKRRGKQGGISKQK